MIIKNAKGELLNINVVRYFRLNGIEYLIFSLGEKDDGGYVKLYISKVNGNIANTITDDVEWNMITDTIKTIIKSNKDNLPLSIVDLSEQKISNLQIVDQKSFKLNDSFLQLLSANKKEEIYVAPVATPNIEVNPTILNPMPEILPTIEPATYNNINYNSTINNPGTEQIVESSINSKPFEQSNINLNNPAVDNNFQINNLSPDALADYSLDYKTLYENESNKNAALTQEIDKYRAIINELKNIIDKAI